MNSTRISVADGRPIDYASLRRKTLLGLVGFLATLWILIFLPAWSLTYWQGWVFLSTFGVSITAISLYFLKHDPRLIRGRLKAGPAAETQRSQKIIQVLSSAFFIALVLVPGFDHRHGWSAVPASLVALGDVGVVAGLFIVFLVFKANSYTSGVIEVQEKQTVISTGPYAVVRHPMYAGDFIMLLGVPLALGSWWDFVPVFLLIAVIVWRLVEEEAFLAEKLPGYTEYRSSVRYRLIPRVW
jgi:protein-S-isoprenylcysteine O-methyltransferase Ste14